MVLFCVLVFLVVQGGLSAVISTTPAECVYNGKTYQIGEHFSPSPCEPCYCLPGGQVACAMVDCMMPMCVDAVRKPDQCCATCPNGYNCKHGSTVIKMGGFYRPDSDTECSCPYTGPGGFGGPMSLQAVCSSA